MHPPPVWSREPSIKPNYNMTKYKRFPLNMANQMKKVLLYTNVTEENKLEVRTRQLSCQRAQSVRSGQLNRQAFIVRQIMQEMQLQAMGLNRASLLPGHLVKEHRHLALFHNFFYMGGKDLPIHHRLDRFFLKSLQNAQIDREVVRTKYTVKTQKALTDTEMSDIKDIKCPKISSFSTESSQKDNPATISTALDRLTQHVSAGGRDHLPPIEKKHCTTQNDEIVFNHRSTDNARRQLSRDPRGHPGTGDSRHSRLRGLFKHPQEKFPDVLPDVNSGQLHANTEQIRSTDRNLTSSLRSDEIKY